MCKKAIKIINKVDPLQGGDKILDKLGLPSLMGEKHGLLAEPEVATGSTVTAPGAPPTENSAGSLESREAEKRRRLAASGQNATILTGPNGVTSAASTGAKTLLGA